MLLSAHNACHLPAAVIDRARQTSAINGDEIENRLNLVNTSVWDVGSLVYADVVAGVARHVG